METRANFLLIGIFTVAGFLGMLGFLLWFARLELDRQYDYYDVTFDSVSGLSNASQVRFSGLLVGSVVSIGLAPDGSGRVVARLEVAADTPIRTSSVATIESLGVTGVSYVGITAGEPDDMLLSAASGKAVPDIPAGRSALQSLTEDAPDILEEVLQVTRNLSDLLGPDNQARVSGILTNVEAASADLQTALDDFSKATNDISAFTGNLDGIAATATRTLDSADETFRQVTEFARRAETSLDTGDAALDSARKALDAATLFIEGDLPRTTQEIDLTLTTVRDQFASLSSNADAALEAADKAFTSADRVLNTEVGEVAASLQQTLGALDSAIASASDDIPAITASLREATERANATMAEVEQVANSLAGPLQAFATTGLPQYTRLALQARDLIANLERLTRAIERDPARFVLGRDAPAFRR